MKFLFKLICYFTLGLIIGFLIDNLALAKIIYPKITKEFASTSVLIINEEESAGGSGVIWKSYDKVSFVLTNRHVCELLIFGGKVRQENTQYLVTAYKISQVHDICLIQVNDNLGVNTELSHFYPELYSKAFISGHPNLYPHVLSTGDFSGNMKVSVQIGVKSCDKEEFSQNPIECIFEGSPVILNLDAQLVTALIAPGSSGSGVFNEEGELVGLVFASNSKQLSYALIVPYYYLQYFLSNEYKNLAWIFPKIVSKPTDIIKEKTEQKAYIQPYLESPEGFYDIENWKKLFNLLEKDKKCIKK